MRMTATSDANYNSDIVVTAAFWVSVIVNAAMCIYVCLCVVVLVFSIVIGIHSCSLPCVLSQPSSSDDADGEEDVDDDNSTAEVQMTMTTL